MKLERVSKAKPLCPTCNQYLSSPPEWYCKVCGSVFKEVEE